MTFLDMLFPVKCPFCMKQCDKSFLKLNGMCSECMKDLDIYKGADSFPNESIDNVLRLYCPLKYTGDIKKAIISYKFGGQMWMSEYFTVIIHKFLRDNGAYEYCDYISFVPIGSKRYRERGFDQSRLIAEGVSSRSGIPLLDVLERTDSRNAGGYTSKMNMEQRLSEKRFVLSEGKIVPKGAEILLVDDILTTGSTLKECAAILLKAGAGSVSAAVIASGRRDILPDKERYKEA